MLNIFLDVTLRDQDEVFLYIAKKAKELGYIGDEQELIKGFKHRESESTTGFEEGFAIPHARIPSILKTGIFFIRLQNGVEWNSMDGQPAKYVIALLVPEGDASAKHIEILSTVARSLLVTDFKNILIGGTQDEIEYAFKNILETGKGQSSSVSNLENDMKKNDGVDKSKILAITACPVGIAHTYIAADKIAEAGNKLGYSIKVETHGSQGVKNHFTDKEIQDAEVIILATDIGIDRSRFQNKRIYEVKVKEAISDPYKVINDSIMSAAVYTGKDTSNESIDRQDKDSKFVKHLLSGVSYMIPFIIFGGLMIALALGIGRSIYDDGNIPSNTFLWYLLESGVAAFGLMIAVLAGFIANSIAGRAAIAPAMILGWIANQTALIYRWPIPGFDTVETPLGFIGAILFGMIIGYTVKWINSWVVHKNISAVMPIFIIPLGVTLFYALLSIFVIAPPIAYISGQLGRALATVFTNTSGDSVAIRVGVGVGLGLVLGAMAGFDMGGPINKIAFVTASALISFTPSIQNPMGMVAAAIPIAPLGMGIAAQVYRNKFSEQERGLGISAIIMGFIGISEGAIPFAIADPKRAILANVLGSAVAGAIAGALGVTDAVAHGGPIVAILGAVSGNFIGTGSVALGLGILFYFVAVIIGTAVTILSYGLFLKVIKYKTQDDLATDNGKISFSRRFKVMIDKIKGGNKKGGSVLTIAAKERRTYLVLLGVAASAWIAGFVLFGIYFQELNDFIQAINSGVTDAVFPIGMMYGLLFIVLGALIVIAEIMIYFSMKLRKKENENEKYEAVEGLV